MLTLRSGAAATALFWLFGCSASPTRNEPKAAPAPAPVSATKAAPVPPRPVVTVGPCRSQIRGELGFAFGDSPRRVEDVALDRCKQGDPSALKEKLDDLRGCYEQALARSGRLTAQLRLRYGTDQQGKIVQVHVSRPGDAELASCVASESYDKPPWGHFSLVHECDVTFETTKNRFAPTGTVVELGKSSLVVDGKSISMPQSGDVPQRAAALARLIEQSRIKKIPAHTAVLLRAESAVDTIDVDLVLHAFHILGQDRAYLFARNQGAWQLVTPTPSSWKECRRQDLLALRVSPATVEVFTGSSGGMSTALGVFRSKRSSPEDATAFATALDQARAQLSNLHEARVFLAPGQSYSVLVSALRATDAKGIRWASFGCTLTPRTPTQIPVCADSRGYSFL